MKPGMSRNIENPEMSVMQAEANAAQVGMGSNQDPMTTQTANKNPNRLRPAYSGVSTGMSVVNEDGTMADQSSNYSASAKNVDAMRRKIYG